MIPEFQPVRDIDDLLTLDPDEIVAGYQDGRAGEPEPGNNRSRSHWHGWRNGSVDSGRIPKDDAMAALARSAAPGGHLDPRLLEHGRRYV